MVIRCITVGGISATKNGETVMYRKISLSIIKTAYDCRRYMSRHILSLNNQDNPYFRLLFRENQVVARPQCLQLIPESLYLIPLLLHIERLPLSLWQQSWLS